MPGPPLVPRLAALPRRLAACFSRSRDWEADMARVFALLTLVVGGLIVADLWAHPQVTNNVISAGTSTANLLAGK